MSASVHIAGTTRLYAIVGDPISQVKSPEVFSGMFAAAGLDAVMVPVHAPSERFETIVPVLKMMGNVDGLIFREPLRGR